MDDMERMRVGRCNLAASDAIGTYVATREMAKVIGNCEFFIILKSLFPKTLRNFPT